MRQFTLIGVVLLGSVLAQADPYWIAYEGNRFPEQEGWKRIHFEQEAKRWIDNGTLVIDSRESVRIVEFYEMHMNGKLDPRPGETFSLTWRMLINDVIGHDDPGVSVFSDEKWAVGFTFDTRTVRSSFEPGVEAPIEPGVWHAYELRSTDMRGYELFIDGQRALTGSFWLSLSYSSVGWGDVVEGGASLVRWDYVRFGTIPEPPTLQVALAPVLVVAFKRRATLM